MDGSEIDKMLIKLICIGTKMPAWVDQGFGEYAKRLNKDVKILMHEVTASKRAKTLSIEKIKLEEAMKIRKALCKDSYIVTLDVQGKQWGTEELSGQLTRWLHMGQNINLIVGGADGLDESILKLANQSWSLSKLTFPHSIVRIVIAEQIYRAWSLLNNHPYHRA